MIIHTHHGVTTERIVEPTNARDMSIPTTVPVGRTRVALIDPEDAELVSGYRWNVLSARNGRVYAVTQVGGRTIYMHRLIAATPAGFETDHHDQNGLNNQRSNLRIATPSQNRANGPKMRTRAGRATSSRFRGVHRSKGSGKWQAQIRVDGVLTYLGKFTDEEAAARAYDAAARGAWGEFARLNFPEGA